MVHNILVYFTHFYVTIRILWEDFHAMNWEDQPLVTDEPVQFEKSQFEVQDFRRFPIILEEYGEYTSHR